MHQSKTLKATQFWLDIGFLNQGMNTIWKKIIGVLFLIPNHIFVRSSKRNHFVVWCLGLQSQRHHKYHSKSGSKVNSGTIHHSSRSISSYMFREVKMRIDKTKNFSLQIASSHCFGVSLRAKHHLYIVG